jgi:ankyrin repeat protein
MWDTDTRPRPRTSQNNQKKLCKMLHQRGGNLNTQNRQGQTALHFAFAFGYTELGKWLVKANADTTLKNMHGMTCYEGLSPAQPAMPFVHRYVTGGK